MHARPQHVCDDQAEELGDGRILGLEGVDGREHRGERGQSNAKKDRPEGDDREIRIVLSGDNLRQGEDGRVSEMRGEKGGRPISQ